MLIFASYENVMNINVKDKDKDKDKVVVITGSSRGIVMEVLI